MIAPMKINNIKFDYDNSVLYEFEDSYGNILTWRSNTTFLYEFTASHGIQRGDILSISYDRISDTEIDKVKVLVYYTLEFDKFRARLQFEHIDFKYISRDGLEQIRFGENISVVYGIGTYGSDQGLLEVMVGDNEPEGYLTANEVFDKYVTRDIPRIVINLDHEPGLPIIYGDCANCNHEVIEVHKFCWNCGQKLDWSRYE